MAGREEEDRLRSVALQNAASIQRARQRAEQDLLTTRDALEQQTQALARSLAMIRATLESTADGILVTDADGRITDFNRTYVQMWGLSTDMVGKGEHRRLLAAVAHHLSDPAAFLARIERIYAEQPPETFDLLQLTDGRVLERVTRQQLVEGRNVGRVWSFRDITPRVRVEQELRQQREWFAVTLSSIGDAVLATDAESRVTFLNPVAERMTGWPSDEARGQRLDDICRMIHEVTRQPVENPITRVLREGRVVELANHTSLLSRTGAEIAIEDSAAPIRDAAGNISGAVMVFHDVTGRRAAEDALRASEARLRAVFHQSTVGMAIAGLDGRFEQVNQRFVEILGYTVDEIRQRTFADITHPEDLASTQAHVRRLLAGEVADYVVEKRYVHKSGRHVWSRTSVTLLKSATGEPQHFVGVIEDITQRREAEEIRLRLAAVVESSDDAIISKDLTGTITTWNRGAEHMYGYTAEEVIGKSITILIPEDRFDEEPGILDRLKRGERIDHYETVRRHKNGALLDVSITVSPIKDSSGRTIGASKIARDITGRKRAEAELREQAAVLELLNQTGRTIASTLDLQSLVQFVTDAATKLSGAKFGAFFYNVVNQQGESFTLYTLSGAPRESFEQFGLPRNTAVFDPTFHGEGVVRSADITKDPRYGRNHPHHGMPAGHLPVRSYLAAPVVSRSGEVIGGLFFGHPETDVFTERAERLVTGVAAQAAIAIDNARLFDAAQKQIAERTQAELRLRESETRLRLSLEATGLGVWDWQPADDALALDERARKMLTLPPDAAMNYATLLSLIHPGDRARADAAMRAALQAGGPGRFEFEHRLALPSNDNHPRWIRATGKAFFGDRGEAVRLIGTVLDITSVVAARETLAERREELERLVAERTASLQEAIAQMEEFSYTVSHDLRSPVRAMRGYADVLLADFAGQLDEEARALLLRIARNGRRMDRLIQDVLIYSRISRRAIHLETVALDRLVHELVHQFPEMQSAQAEIAIVGKLPAVLGHEPSLAQAISNLLTNAVKFVAPGTRPVVRISAEQTGDRVKVWFADNGIGIKPEHQRRLFGMFERIHPETRYEGTGIGLAIVRKAVERMSGAVGVESDGMSGSRFWIELAAAESP